MKNKRDSELKNKLVNTSPKMAQEVKISLRNFPKLCGKSAQEEMVGFGMIIIIVSVILMIIIGFALKKSTKEENLENYEVESFVQSALQYTTDCENSIEPLTVQNLIFYCYNNESCIDGRFGCYVLNHTMNEMIKSSWAISNNRVYKGYQFKISVENRSLMTDSYGNQTGNSKGSRQYLSKSYGDAEITLKVFA